MGNFFKSVGKFIKDQIKWGNRNVQPAPMTIGTITITKKEAEAKVPVSQQPKQTIEEMRPKGMPNRFYKVLRTKKPTSVREQQARRRRLHSISRTSKQVNRRLGA